MVPSILLARSFSGQGTPTTNSLGQTELIISSHACLFSGVHMAAHLALGFLTLLLSRGRTTSFGSNTRFSSAELSGILEMESLVGFEPTLLVWRTNVLAVEHQRDIYPAGETGTLFCFYRRTIISMLSFLYCTGVCFGVSSGSCHRNYSLEGCRVAFRHQ